MRTKMEDIRATVFRGRNVHPAYDPYLRLSLAVLQVAARDNDRYFFEYAAGTYVLWLDYIKLTMPGTIGEQELPVPRKFRQGVK